MPGSDLGRFFEHFSVTHQNGLNWLKLFSRDLRCWFDPMRSKKTVFLGLLWWSLFFSRGNVVYSDLCFLCWVLNGVNPFQSIFLQDGTFPCLIFCLGRKYRWMGVSMTPLSIAAPWFMRITQKTKNQKDSKSESVSFRYFCTNLTSSHERGLTYPS